MHLDPRELVVDKVDDFVNILFARVNGDTASPPRGNSAKDASGDTASSSTVLSACVSTLALVAPKEVYPRLAAEVLEALKNPALKDVSKTDLEIAAMPEGELYNVDVIKGGPEEGEEGAGGGAV